MKNDAKLEEELTCRFKIEKSFKSFKNLLFNRIFLNKVYNVWAKQVEGSYVSWHWRVMQNNLWCGKWHEEFGKFLPQRS